MGELSQEQIEHQTEIKALKAEIAALKKQIVQVQKAYLMQQRELNALQLEKLNAIEAGMTDQPLREP